MIVHTAARYCAQWVKCYNELDVWRLTRIRDGREVTVTAALIHGSDRLKYEALAGYEADAAGDPEAVLRDAERVVTAFEKRDFEEQQQFFIDRCAELRENGSVLEMELPKIDHDSCFVFLRDLLWFQYKALDDMRNIDPVPYYDRLHEMISEKVGGLYKQPEAGNESCGR